MSKVILITGCSTGIGRDLVARLTQSRYTVVATARKLESLADLPAALKLPLDVTQPESITRAVEGVVERFGRIDVLVNNAGYAVRGAIEETSDEQVQAMFDVNVFGVMRMVRAVVPHMRRQGAGRIVNISSIAGKLSTPANGTYSATKFALEALSDALRIEVAPFGIKVIVVEPGSTNTHFRATAEAHTPASASDPASPYRHLYQQSEQFSAGMQQYGPEAVSRVVQHALEAYGPKARYLAAIAFSGRLVLRLGDSAWDLILRQIFKPVTAP